MSSETERLVARCQKGELAAFTELFRQYETAVYRLALTILRNEQDAQDVVQDSFLRVFERIKHYQGRSSFKTWLTTIVVNLCRDCIRRRKVRQAFSLEWLHSRPGGGSVVEEVAEREHRQTIWTCVEQLDDKYRLPLILHYLEELPCDEVARILNIRTSTVYSRLNTARLKVRELAQEEQPAGGGAWELS